MDNNSHSIHKKHQSDDLKQDSINRSMKNRSEEVKEEEPLLEDLDIVITAKDIILHPFKPAEIEDNHHFKDSTVNPDDL